jgi:hypothetical protein
MYVGRSATYLMTWRLHVIELSVRYDLGRYRTLDLCGRQLEKWLDKTGCSLGVGRSFVKMKDAMQQELCLNTCDVSNKSESRS